MDVANAATFGDLPMVLLWQIVYMAIAILCVFVIPFALFYYEAEDPERYQRAFLLYHHVLVRIDSHITEITSR